MTEETLETLRREMSTSPSIFAEDLHKAFPGCVNGGPVEFYASHAAATMHIILKPAQDRVIALIRISTLLVQIHFTTGNNAQRKAMLKRMDNYMQRGGG